MSSAASARRPDDNGSAERNLTIGQVLEALREEFPSISHSKVRYYEERGLVSPHRTPGNYRKYGQADIDRLRYALRAKRDHFLPLEVIREDLDKIDRGLTPQLPDVRPTVPADAGDLPQSARMPRSSSSLRLTAAELGEATGADVRMLKAMQDQGLLPAEVDGYYREDAVAVVAAAVALAEVGLEPRHLRALGLAAERIVSLVETAVASERTRADRRARAEDRADAITAAALSMHSAMVAAGVNRLLDR